MANAAVTLAEIEKMLTHFPQGNQGGCHDCEREKTALEKIIQHGQRWQVNEQSVFKIERPRLCLFASSHGVIEDGVAQTKEKLTKMAEGKSVQHQLCRLADAELRVYELDVDHPTANIGQGNDAMAQEDAARAMTYGMMAVEPGLDIIVLDSLSAGADQVADAVMTRLSDKSIQSKQSPLEVLCRFGGYDFCAMLGASIAARMAGIPVFVDSHSGRVVQHVLAMMADDGADHIYFIGEKECAASSHRAMALIPSLKAYLITKPACQSSCQGNKSDAGACATKRHQA